MLTSTKKIFIVFTTFLLIFGCASHSKVGRLPELKDPDKAGKIVIIRNKNFVGGGVQYFVNVDWVDILGLYAGEYTEFDLNPGKHFVGVKCYGGWSPGPKLDGVEVKIKENDKLYFVISPNFVCADIKKISNEEAAKRIQDSEFVPYERKDKNNNSTESKVKEKKEPSQNSF